MIDRSSCPGSRRSTIGSVFRVRAAAILFAGCAVAWPATAQTLQEVKDAMEMMVASAAICSDYLARPEVLEQTRQTGQRELTKAGLSQGEAEAFMDEVAAGARAKTSSETQKQVACEMVNIRALE